jgi:hypothetical protein
LIVEFIREHADRREERDNGGLRWGVEPICTVLTEHGLPIAPSTYYAHVFEYSFLSHKERLALDNTTLPGSAWSGV